MKQAIIWLLMISTLVLGCSEPPKHPYKAYVLKSEFITITPDDFSDELELKKAAYPYNLKENPVEYNQMIVSLVQMLTEEVVLLSAAKQVGITVSKEELEQAIVEFKKDYPEDSFEQILLENAIPYSFWKTRFKKLMLMDRLIDSELRQKIKITPEDIVRFYGEYQKKEKLKSEKNDSVMTSIGDEKELVAKLRLRKTQERYDDWIKGLTVKYPVEINNKMLKKYLLKTKTAKDDRK